MALEHRHAEAFRRMQYRCEKCGQIEWVWNSRDGITAFIVNSRCCDVAAPHINWQEDQYLPDYEPLPGERFWRNGTPDEALAITRKRVESIPVAIWDKHGILDLEAYIQELAHDDQEWPAGWCYLETVPESPTAEWMAANLKAAGYGPT